MEWLANKMTTILNFQTFLHIFLNIYESASLFQVSWVFFQYFQMNLN